MPIVTQHDIYDVIIINNILKQMYLVMGGVREYNHRVTHEFLWNAIIFFTLNILLFEYCFVDHFHIMCLQFNYHGKNYMFYYSINNIKHVHGTRCLASLCTMHMRFVEVDWHGIPRGGWGGQSKLCTKFHELTTFNNPEFVIRFDFNIK